MPTRALEFDWPDRAVVGTIGLPGARTFYFQVRSGPQLVTIALEKQQSSLLAEKIDEILDQLVTVEGNPFSVPTSTPPELVDNDPLEDVEERWRTGAMGLGWDPTTAQLVIEAYPLAEDDDSDDFDLPSADDDADADDTEMLVVRMPVGAARAFAKRTHEIVGAGRPICAVCGYPIDPDGHEHTFPDN
jgi:uncharacterized repeat protein (TIGR03847 family)